MVWVLLMCSSVVGCLQLKSIGTIEFWMFYLLYTGTYISAQFLQTFCSPGMCAQLARVVP